MFKDRFVQICNARGVAPTTACRAIGISASTFSTWGDDSVPRRATLQKFADYFGCTVEYLLGDEDGTGNAEKEKAPAEDLSEGERMVLEALRVIPEDQRTAAMMECIAILMQRRQGS